MSGRWSSICEASRALGKWTICAVSRRIVPVMHFPYLYEPIICSVTSWRSLR
jgi:hypothetical protein